MSDQRYIFGVNIRGLLKVINEDHASVVMKEINQKIQYLINAELLKGMKDVVIEADIDNDGLRWGGSFDMDYNQDDYFYDLID